MSTTLENPRHDDPRQDEMPPQARPQNSEITLPVDAPVDADDDIPGDSPRRSFSWVWAFLAVLAIAAVAAGAVSLAGGLGDDDGKYVYHTVVRADLPIQVTERGTLESQENIKIICEVDDVRGDGINGTPIVWLVPNGASVKKDDLLIEFASAAIQEELDEEILETEEARSQEIQSRAAYGNQITQNKTAEANTRLAQRLSELELEMFSHPTNGTHQLEVEEIQRQIDDINNEILADQANLELKKNDKQGIQTLFKLGYAGKSEVDRSRLEYLQAESQFAARINKLKTQLATLAKKESFERQMQKLQLEGNLETAKRQVEQVMRDNEAALEKAKAAKDAAEESLKKQLERLERRKEQVANCKVYAPQDGMVVYAQKSGRRYWEEDIRIGAAVNERQHVLSLPNLKQMQVRLSVHESNLNQIKVGMPASVRVEAFPERQYNGAVKSVAVLAMQQGASSKVYDTVVTVDEDVEDLRPGMTAVTEIHVAYLKDVLTVPVQAVVQVERDSWCYVRRESGVERAPVKLGATNDKFVVVSSGLHEGDQVILNPMAILDEEEEQQDPSAALSPEEDDTPEPAPSPSDLAEPEPDPASSGE